MRSFLVALSAMCLSLTLIGCGSDTPKCKKGKPCGETCIDKDKECRK